MLFSFIHIQHEFTGPDTKVPFFYISVKQLNVPNGYTNIFAFHVFCLYSFREPFNP